MSGAQWRTGGELLNRFATLEVLYLSQIPEIVAKVAHHINKYKKKSKKNACKGTLGGFVRHFATCYTLFPIPKPKTLVANSALVRHSVRHSKGGHA